MQPTPGAGANIYIVYSEFDDVREVFNSREEAIRNVDNEEEYTGCRGTIVRAIVKEEISPENGGTKKE